MKYAGLLLVLGGAALVLSFKLMKQHAGVRPSLGPVSEQWLFEKRRHSDDQ